MNLLSTAELIRRLALAAGIGAVVGIEREVHHKSAGLRTNILIALGAAVFTMVGIDMAPPGSDPTRLAAQIVTGIGFLGAGAIMRTDGGPNAHGLTTAATVWVNAALGVACGGGEYRLALAGVIFTLGVLLIIGPIERRAEHRDRDQG